MLLESFLMGLEMSVVALLASLILEKKNGKNLKTPLSGICAALLFSIAFTCCVLQIKADFNKAYDFLSSCILFSLYLLFCVSVTHDRAPSFYKHPVVRYFLFFFIIFSLCSFELSAYILNLIKVFQPKDKITNPILSVFWGFAFSFFCAWMAFRIIKKKEWEVTQNHPLMLMLLFFFKTFTGGVPHAVDPPFIVFARKVMETFAHDMFHIFFVTFQLPDHPYLNARVYRWILLAVDKKASVIFTFLAFIPFLIAFFYKQEISRPVPGLESMEGNAEKRILKKQYVKAKQIRFLTYALTFFLLFFSTEHAYVYKEKVYNPEPIPVIEVNGDILAPLSDPLSSIENGRIRKFVFHYKNKKIIFFAVKKDDGNIVAALDVCKICEPEGYAQTGKNYLVCLYCATPIAVSTVGMSGGCNPIPVRSRIIQSQLKIKVSDILSELKIH